jgi:hypothetical protein
MKAVALCCLPLFLLVLTASVSAQDDPKVGDIVWAEWENNAWYHGKITKKTDKDFHIEFDDGDMADVEASQIALDKEPVKKDIKKGTRVLAKWSNDHFYPGKVGDVKEDGNYHIEFDDGDKGDAALKDIRLIAGGKKFKTIR